MKPVRVSCRQKRPSLGLRSWFKETLQKNLATLSNQFAVNPDRQWEFPLWQISTTRKQFTSISKGRYGRHSSPENMAANEMT